MRRVRSSRRFWTNDRRIRDRLLDRMEWSMIRAGAYLVEGYHVAKIGAHWEVATASDGTVHIHATTRTMTEAIEWIDDEKDTR